MILTVFCSPDPYHETDSGGRNETDPDPSHETASDPGTVAEMKRIRNTDSKEHYAALPDVVEVGGNIVLPRENT